MTIVHQLILLVLLLTAPIKGYSSREAHSQRCRSTDDLGRIPWFLPNSTFHNFGFPLIRTLCAENGRATETLGCEGVEHIDYLYESVTELRSGNRSSMIIVEPHMIEGPDAPSSGTYVIMAMFEILYGLGYNPGVRHWSDSMSGMFPPEVSAAASEISHRYDAFRQGKGENPFANTPNHILLQIEVPHGFTVSVPVNPSPYARTFRWIIGFHVGHKHKMYQPSDPTAHCTGANFHQVRGRMCTTSGVIPCPQYEFHRKRSFETTEETRKVTKKNIILFDNDQEEIDMERLKVDVMKLSGLDDLQVLKNQGRKKTDMPDLYKTVKMTIDCRNPGVEFINYEATLYDTMTLACDLRSTRNVFDFPVPSKYHIDPRNWTHLVQLVHDSMVNYEQRVDDFKHFKRLSRSSSQLARSQVDIHYFSRDVMFRTHCGSYAECRRIYPWAVAVWTLYPLAMVEVVSDVDLLQESVDNDLLLLSLPELFTSKYFKIYNSIPGVAPVDMFPRTPCAYMVYMDASFIPFGRDFLNTHVAALVKDPRPIVYWQGDKIAIAVMHARPYMRLLNPGGKSLYVEIDYTIHGISNYETYTDLLKVCLGSESVPGSYLSTFKSGTNFNQGHVQELLKKYPPLPNKPCEDSRRRRRLASSASTTGHAHLRSNETSHHNRHTHKRNHTDHGTVHRCGVPDNLIIDAVYVPRPIAGDNIVNTAGYAAGPSIWLTSSHVPISFKTVFTTFSKGQIKTIVQHLDPILQNSNILKILPFVPGDIAVALKQFDALNFPSVISLWDMEYPHWGEKCD